MKLTIVKKGAPTTTADETPKCGEDFCDSCGDCLACSSPDDLCGSTEGREHVWVKYVEDES